jgi:hypothetical protein
MLATDDVVDLVREAGVVFMDEAILTTLTRPPSYLGSQLLTMISKLTHSHWRCWS